MKVAFINSVYPYGSTGRIVKNLANFVERKGGQAKIFYGRGEKSEGLLQSNFSLYINAFKSRIFGKEGLRCGKNTQKLINGLKDFNPDVIHLHNLHGYYLNYEILFDFLRKFGKKVIWTLHDEWAFTGHCAYYDENCDHVNGCENCNKKSEYPKSIFDNSKSNFLRKKQAFCGIKNLTIVTPSVWLKNIADTTFLSEYPILTINNGVDEEIFTFTQSDFRKKYLLEDKKIILGVSYFWTERKGIEIFNKLSEDLPLNYKIVLVGQTKKLNDKILYISKTDNAKELAKIYSASDIFVNPTFFENYPTVNLEALSCSLPVITFSTGGSGEMINSFNGHVVSKGDYNALKKAILDLTGSFDREKIKQDANRFSNKIFCEKYYRLYNEQK